MRPLQFSSPLSTIHSSRGRFVSGHAQQIFTVGTGRAPAGAAAGLPLAAGGAEEVEVELIPGRRKAKKKHEIRGSGEREREGESRHSAGSFDSFLVCASVRFPLRVFQEITARFAQRPFPP
jgi:hypothetical protein